MQTKTFKNGKVFVREAGVLVTVDPKEFPKVHVSDPLNRYYYFVFRGLQLFHSSSSGERIIIAVEELQKYLKIRGTRTSWTQNDLWLKKWKAAHETSKA